MALTKQEWDTIERVIEDSDERRIPKHELDELLGRVKEERPKPTVVGIQSRYELSEFAGQHGLRFDWHEPDERGIDARIRGTHLDNAMGSTMLDIGENNESGEFNIVLTKDGEDVAVVNLATLLSWAARP